MLISRILIIFFFIFVFVCECLIANLSFRLIFIFLCESLHMLISIFFVKTGRCCNIFFDWLFYLVLTAEHRIEIDWNLKWTKIKQKIKEEKKMETNEWNCLFLFFFFFVYSHYLSVDRSFLFDSSNVKIPQHKKFQIFTVLQALATIESTVMMWEKKGRCGD